MRTLVAAALILCAASGFAGPMQDLTSATAAMQQIRAAMPEAPTEAQLRNYWAAVKYLRRDLRKVTDLGVTSATLELRRSEQQFRTYWEARQ